MLLRKSSGDIVFEMIWENCCFWTGDRQSYDDINPRRFDWWCPECEMAVKGCHVDDGKCPNCGEELNDMGDEIDVYEELHGDGGPYGLRQNEEGDWGYD